jgi:hypothetical protein
MDGIGTFFGTYDNKINDWEKQIESANSNPELKHQLENQMYNYMAECLPFLSKYMNETEQTTVEGPFNTKITKGVQRRELYYEYLRQVEDYKGTFSKTATKDVKRNNRYGTYCVNTNCNSSNIFLDNRSSNYVCQDCGVCEYFLGEELSYKDEQETSEKIQYNSYKRNNHLNEWILQFQGRETTNIPMEVIDQLRSEFKKQKIDNVRDITQARVKTLLRKLRYSKYYEHATYITNILSGLDPPHMPCELEERLRHMFRDVQDPFEKHCPANRSNFLSYSYVLYKFCELLGEDDYLPYFPLLKAKEKLRQQDVIWKGICGELLWEYIPTC